MFGEQILLEIDETLDLLIQNAEALQNVDLKDLTEIELDAFQKTQESLLHHLLRIDASLATKKTQDKRLSNFRMQEKFSKFEKMKSSYHKRIDGARSKTNILSKRRSKQFLA